MLLKMPSILKDLIILEIANNHMGDVNHGINLIDTYSKICNKFITTKKYMISLSRLRLKKVSIGEYFRPENTVASYRTNRSKRVWNCSFHL